MTTLSTGSYHIRSVAAAAGEYVGREAVEDKSYNPKQIVTLPSSAAAQTWDIEVVSGKTYRVKRGGPTGNFQGHVYAFLQDTPPPADWIITPIPQAGAHAYTISTTGDAGGWVLENAAPHSQIALRTLILYPGHPAATFPSNELWEITPA